MWPACYSSWFDGSIEDTLFYAPAAMLYHWNMIEPHDEHIHRELMLMPLLFASYEKYVRSSKSFQEGWKWMEDLTFVKNQLHMDNLCFVMQLRLIWKIPRNCHSNTQ